MHEMNGFLDGIKDRTTREKIAQALTAAKPASLLAATQIVEAQTPPALADDEAEPLAADSEAPEPLAADTEPMQSLWPAESALDEPSLEQEYHRIRTPATSNGGPKSASGSYSRRGYNRGGNSIGVPPAEREHLREQIDNLIGWLKAARADLEAE